MPGLKYANLISYQNEVATGLLPVLPESFCNHYNFPDVRPFIWNGYSSFVRYTYVVSLDNEMETRLERDTRYEIKHSKVEVHECKDAQFFDALYEQTFTRKGLNRTASKELINKLFETMNPLMFVASDNSSATVMIQDSKRAYYILGASDGSGTSAKTLWESLVYLKEHGIKEVDLTGCNDYKINLFKRGFGGKLMPYYGVQNA
jgi:lipid II:glycine glycyltransferase (peptidoglycan interpeptide bridge formation enzyme)